MSSTFEVLPGEAIILQVLNKDYDYKTESVSGMKHSLHVLDQQPQPVYYIIDMIELVDGMFSLEDLIGAVNLAAYENSLFKHPNILEMLVVTQSRLLDLAMKGLESGAFGNVKIKGFATREEALTYARHNLFMQNAGKH